MAPPEDSTPKDGTAKDRTPYSQLVGDTPPTGMISCYCPQH